jgi:hypothetical protein
VLLLEKFKEKINASLLLAHFVHQHGHNPDAQTVEGEELPYFLVFDVDVEVVLKFEVSELSMTQPCRKVSNHRKEDRNLVFYKLNKLLFFHTEDLHEFFGIDAQEVALEVCQNVDCQSAMVGNDDFVGLMGVLLAAG